MGRRNKYVNEYTDNQYEKLLAGYQYRRQT
jgi:hypothetical protein